MLNLRYIIRFIKAFFLRFRGIIVIGILFGISVFFILRFVTPKLFGKSTEKIGITGRYTADTLPVEVLGLIGDGLTAVNEKGVVEPNLAESWESTDGGKTWIFVLKDDLYWQDGKKLESGDINYAFSDVEIKTPDPKTVVFSLKESFSPFPSVVSKPMFKKGLLSTGEWEVSKASLAGNIVQSLVLVNSKKDKLIFKFYPTEERTKLAFKLGEVNTIQDIFNPAPLNEWRTAQTVKESNENQVVSVFFNTQDPLLSDKTLRQALNYAIDKKALTDSRALSPVSPESWAYNPQVKPYDYDLSRAKELLETSENGEEIEIKLATSVVLLSTAEKISKYWEEIGIKTVVQVTSVIPSEYQAYLAILDMPKDPDQYSFWHSTQTATNISSLQNPRIDKLLEDGRIELTLSERKRIYLDFQRFLVEELPAAFLYHPETYSIIRK